MYPILWAMASQSTWAVKQPGWPSHQTSCLQLKLGLPKTHWGKNDTQRWHVTLWGDCLTIASMSLCCVMVCSSLTSQPAPRGRVQLKILRPYKGKLVWDALQAET